VKWEVVSPIFWCWHPISTTPWLGLLFYFDKSRSTQLKNKWNWPPLHIDVRCVHHNFYEKMKNHWLYYNFTETKTTNIEAMWLVRWTFLNIAEVGANCACLQLCMRTYQCQLNPKPFPIIIIMAAVVMADSVQGAVQWWILLVFFEICCNWAGGISIVGSCNGGWVSLWLLPKPSFLVNSCNWML
jgi:hypothetical protein